MIEGHVYAGGLIFAMCHDYRVMKANSGKLCLSEINIGNVLPPAYNDICKYSMPRQILREMIMGRPISVKEALQHKVITAEYQD